MAFANSTTRACIAACAFLWVSAPVFGAPLTYSVDIASPVRVPTGFTAGDILLPGPSAFIRHTALNLVDSDAFGDFSFGNDRRESAIHFSVDRVAFGADGTPVNGGSLSGGANGSVYASQPPEGTHSLAYRDSSLGLTGGLFGDDVHGLSLTPYEGRVYFTLEPSSPSVAPYSPADIFLNSPGSIFAGFRTMGLKAGDEIDGLILFDRARIGQLDPGEDVAMFSIGTFSASSVFMGGTMRPGDIFFTSFLGSNSLQYTAESLGLRGDDELHALAVAPVPEPSTALTAGLVCALLLAWRRRKQVLLLLPVLFAPLVRGQDPQVFAGFSPALPGSAGVLHLSAAVPVNQEFRWSSDDTVFGPIEIRLVLPRTWVFIPAVNGPARLVFTAAASGVEISVNALLAPMNRATVDVFDVNARRVRYEVVLRTCGPPHAPGDFSIDANGNDVAISAAPWVATRYYYTNVRPSVLITGGYSTFVDVDRYIPGIIGAGTPLPLSVQNGVISAHARLRVCVTAIVGNRNLPEQFNTGTTDATGAALNLALGGLLQTRIQTSTLDVADVLLPIARGMNGRRPLPKPNILRITKPANTPRVAYVVHWIELSFEAMSPLVLVHGKGANTHFWRGFPPKAGTTQKGKANPCWDGIARHFEIANLPFDESISLGADATRGENSQGSIAAQALELDSYLPGIVTTFGTKHFTILAHSKGGLDSRFWLTDLKASGSGSPMILVQFITLNTPHRGSVVADYVIAGSNLSTFPELARAELAAARIHGDIPILLTAPVAGRLFGMKADTAATADLTTASMARFNSTNMQKLAAYVNPDSTVPAFWATRGDADRSRNGNVVDNVNELAVAVCYEFGTGIFGNSAYQALYRVSNVSLSAPDPNTGVRDLVQVETAPNFRRNDLLVTFDSADPGPPFVLAGTFLKDHARIADEGTGAFLRANGRIVKLK